MICRKSSEVAGLTAGIALISFRFRVLTLTTPYPPGMVFPNENEDLVITILMLRNIA